MKKIEKVFKQLSELYELNKKIMTYTFSPSKSAQGQQGASLDAGKVLGTEGQVSERRKRKT
jgi:hypothetical protein